MARAERGHIMSDRLVGDTGATATKMMRIIGGESTSERNVVTGGFIMTYDLAALAALTSLICMC